MSDPPTQSTPPTEAPVDVSAPKPLRTGLAVTALILGVAGLFTCLPAGIAGVVTGIVALHRISREPHRHGGRGMAIGGLVCGGLSLVLIPIFALMVSILLPSLARARELSKRLVCASNMKGIAATMQIYMNAHADEGVPTIGWLVQQGLVSSRQVVCPSATSPASNYVCVPAALGALHSDPSGDSQTVLIYEPKSNHAGEGGNVIFTDGHTKFVRAAAHDELIESVPDN